MNIHIFFFQRDLAEEAVLALKSVHGTVFKAVNSVEYLCKMVYFVKYFVRFCLQLCIPIDYPDFVKKMTFIGQIELINNFSSNLLSFHDFKNYTNKIEFKTKTEYVLIFCHFLFR